MKKVINGKTYNTETASTIGFYSAPYSVNDHHYFKETLYKTKKGNFFLAGEGGGLTKYARQCGDSVCYGDGIIPLDPDSALSWVERNLNPELTEKLFSHMIEEA